MILNVCFLGYTSVNVGEAFTQPIDYFTFDDEAKKVPFEPVAATADLSAIIVGGGGVMRGKQVNAWRQLREIVDGVPETIPIVMWGIGINDHGRLDRQYDEIVADLAERRNVLMGLRDNFFGQYVPCASCMRPEFDEAITIQHDVGLYVHHAHDITSGDTARLPAMSNKIQGDRHEYFGRVIRFLGSCHTVITNTYHGTYWATLLNRRVVVVAPFSNKFLGFRHEPVIVPDASWVSHAIGWARNYPDALQDSREVNRAFYERAVAFLHERQPLQRRIS